MQIKLSRTVPISLAGTISLCIGAHAETLIPVPAASADAVARMQDRDVLWAAAELLALAIPFFFLVTGLGARLRTLCSRLTGARRFWTLALFACMYLLFAGLITLPLDYYRDYVQPHAFGWSHQSAPEWLSGKVVQLLVRLIIAALFIWIPYRLIAWNPRRWWLYASLALIPVVFMVLVGLPVWVYPLTTSYKPLQDKPLEVRIEALSARCGVSRIPVYVGGDEDTVIGLGPTNRIILDEDIFKTETPDEIEFTVGHELKHYVQGDNYKALAIVTGLLLVGFSQHFGFSELTDPASVPLFVLILTLFWLAVLPFFNLYTRNYIEHEADRFGLELTHQNRAMGELFSNYITRDHEVADWDTFFRIFRATHPSNAERIRFANTYHPWVEGKPLVYGYICNASP
jgi:STE24 endopeptidase